ncbi:MAG: ORF6N domain-containing protein, partial [Candidatus Saccharibacteria bacterium]|nr:ORF6N domain-containing protein [Candidatus Saccharibacteria bacterium]
NGQIYDAYSKICEIFSEAKEKLIIIDNYADKTILDIVKRLKIDVKIITKADNTLTKQDVLKYNKQYCNLKVVYNDTFHDRYFILDDKKVYHCGASVNRIGYKTFSITLVEDGCILGEMLKRVKSLK